MIRVLQQARARRHFRRHVLITLLNVATIAMIETHPLHAGLVNFATTMLWLWEE